MQKFQTREKQKKKRLQKKGQTVAIINNTNLFNELQNILIVNKLNVAPINFFLRILLLLHFKHMLQQKKECIP